MKKGALAILGILAIGGIFTSLWYFLNIIVSIIASLLIIIIIIQTNKTEKIGREILIAFFFALFITSYFSYNYSSTNYLIGKINLFPLIAWTAGLIFTKEAYEKLPFKKERTKLLTITALYLAILFSIEYIGYYLFNIQLSSNYSSLLGLGIIHGPIAIKAYYLGAGPIYILTTNYLFKNCKK
jgi:hypothetical protein